MATLARIEQLRLEGLPRRATYSADFEAFWEVYPRKVGKRRAFVCWQRQLRNGVSAALLVQAARHYAEATADTEERYVMHPSTFLGPYDRWEDYVEPYRPKSVAQRRFEQHLQSQGREPDHEAKRFARTHAELERRQEALRRELTAKLAAQKAEREAQLRRRR